MADSNVRGLLDRLGTQKDSREEIQPASALATKFADANRISQNHTREVAAKSARAEVDHPIVSTARLNSTDALTNIAANTVNTIGLGGAQISSIAEKVLGQGAELIAQFQESGLSDTTRQNIRQNDIYNAELERHKKYTTQLRVAVDSGRMTLEQAQKAAESSYSKVGRLALTDDQKNDINANKDTIEKVQHWRYKADEAAGNRAKGQSGILGTADWANRSPIEELMEEARETSSNTVKEDDSTLTKIRKYSSATAEAALNNPAAIAGVIAESGADMLTRGVMVASAVAEGANQAISGRQNFQDRTGYSGLVDGEQGRINFWAGVHGGLNYVGDAAIRGAAVGGQPVVDSVKGLMGRLGGKTAAEAAVPTVGGALAKGGATLTSAVGTEYLTEGTQSVIEEGVGQLNYDNMFDAQAFAEGGTLGAIAGGVISSPGVALKTTSDAVVANTLQDATANGALATIDEHMDINNKHYSPSKAMTKTYQQATQQVEGDDRDEATRFADARTATKDILNKATANLTSLVQAQAAMNDPVKQKAALDGISALESDISSLEAQIDQMAILGQFDQMDAITAQITAKKTELEGLQAQVNINDQVDLENKINIARQELTKATEAYSTATQILTPANDQVEEITQRLSILDNPDATYDDLRGAVDDILNFPQLGSKDALQKIIDRADEFDLDENQISTLRQMLEIKQELLGTSISEVSTHVRKGAATFKGLVEYEQDFNAAMVNGESDVGLAQFESLGNFEYHLTNKINAYDEAMREYSQRRKEGDDRAIQIHSHENGKWEVNYGKPITGKKWTDNRGVAVHSDSINLRVAMAKDLAAIKALRKQMALSLKGKTAEPTTENNLQAYLEYESGLSAARAVNKATEQAAVAQMNEDLFNEVDNDTVSVDVLGESTVQPSTDVEPNSQDSEVEVPLETSEVLETSTEETVNQAEVSTAVQTSAQEAPVQLPVTGQYTAKDQLKADKANKFIGKGSEKSSTAAYAVAYGDQANTGQYTSEDVVFISAEGARNGRLEPDFAEIQKAMNAGATLITDTPENRNRQNAKGFVYNVGEQQVADYLSSNGYVETDLGVWTPSVQSNENVEPTETPTASTPNQDESLEFFDPFEGANSFDEDVEVDSYDVFEPVATEESDVIDLTQEPVYEYTPDMKFKARDIRVTTDKGTQDFEMHVAYFGDSSNIIITAKGKNAAPRYFPLSANINQIIADAYGVSIDQVTDPNGHINDDYGDMVPQAFMDAEEYRKGNHDGEHAHTAGIIDNALVTQFNREQIAVDDNSAVPLEGAIPNLRNEKHKAFKYFTQKGFRGDGSFLGQFNPLALVKDLLNTAFSEDNVLGVIQFFSRFTRSVFDQDNAKVMGRLNQFMYAPDGRQESYSELMDKIVANTTIDQETETNLADWLVTDENGVKSFSENIKTAMAVAHINWLVGAESNFISNDKSTKILLGEPEESRVLPSILTKYRFLESQQHTAIKKLGNDVVRALGLSAKKDVDAIYLDRMVYSLGYFVYTGLKAKQAIVEQKRTDKTRVEEIAASRGFADAAKVFRDILGKNSMYYGDFIKKHKALVPLLKKYTSIPSNFESYSNYYIFNDGVIPFKDDVPDATVRQISELYASLRDTYQELNRASTFVGLTTDTKEVAKYGKERFSKTYAIPTHVRRQFEGFGMYDNTFTNLFGVSSSFVVPLSSPTSFNQKSIKRSLGVVPTELADRLDALQQEPVIIKPFANLILNMYGSSYDSLLSILGVDYKHARENLHVSRRQGKEAAYGNIERDLQNALTFVNMNGDQEFFHEFFVASNHRVHYKTNIFNPQTSKIARAMQNYKKNVVSLDRRSNVFKRGSTELSDYGALLHAFSMFAEGVTKDAELMGYSKDFVDKKLDKTIDKQTNENILPLLKNLVETNPIFQDAFQTIYALQRGEQVSPSKMAELSDLVGRMDGGLQGFEALVELANYLDPALKGKKFKSFLIAESDGITNGASINHIMNGTMNVDELLQAGITHETNGDTDYFKEKAKGLSDRYQRTGEGQLKHWSLIQDEFTIPAEVIEAINTINTAFGNRAGGKVIGNPDNYAAGFATIRKAVATGFLDQVYDKLEKYVQNNDIEAANKLIDAINNVLAFYNNELAFTENTFSPEELYTKIIARTSSRLHPKDVPDTWDMSDIYVLYDSVIRRALKLKANENIPTSRNVEVLNAVWKVINERSPFALNLSQDVNNTDYLLHVTDAKSLRDLIDKDLGYNVANALMDVANHVQGAASVRALYEHNKKFYEVRTSNIAVTQQAFLLYDTLYNARARAEVNRKLLAGELDIAKVRKSLKSDEQISVYADLLSQDEVRKIENDLRPYLPTGDTGFSKGSKNRSSAGIVFAEEGRGAVGGEGRIRQKASIYNPTLDSQETFNLNSDYVSWLSPGLSANSGITQSNDAFISISALTKMLGWNFHDSNGFPVNKVVEGAKGQNEAFYRLMVEHSTQESFLQAVLRPLQGLLKQKNFALLQEEIDFLNEALRNGTVLLEHIEVMREAELNKLNLLMGVTYVNQYGTEGGGYTVTDADRKTIQKKIDHINSGKSIFDTVTPRLESLLTELEAVKTSAIPASIIDLNSGMAEVAPERIEARLEDIDNEALAESPSAIQEMIGTHGRENVPVNDIVNDLVKSFGSDGFADIAKLILGSNGLEGVTVNFVSAGKLFNHVEGADQITKGAAGWYNPATKQINIVLGRADLETVLHEAVHATLTHYIRHNRAISRQVRELQEQGKTEEAKALRATIHQGYASLNSLFAELRKNEALVEQFPNAFANLDEFLAYALSDAKLISALRNIHFSEKNYSRFKYMAEFVGRATSAYRVFLNSVLGFFGMEQRADAKQKVRTVSALEALFAGIAVARSEVNDAHIDYEQKINQTFNQMADVKDDAAKYVDSLSVADTIKELAVSPQRQESFTNHLMNNVVPKINALYAQLDKTPLGEQFLKGNVNSQWAVMSVQGKTPTVSSLVRGQFRLDAQEQFAVEALEYALDAAIDGIYGTSIHNEMLRAFKQAKATVKVQDFHKGDWDKATHTEKMLAKNRYETIFNPSLSQDKNGRNHYLTRFMALALGSQEFYNITNISAKSAKPSADKSWFDTLVGWFNALMETIEARIARTPKYGNVNSKIGVLVRQLAEVKHKHKDGLFARTYDAITNKLNGTAKFGAAVRGNILGIVKQLGMADSRFRLIRSAGNAVEASLSQTIDEWGNHVVSARNLHYQQTTLGMASEIANEIASPKGIKLKLMNMLAANNNNQKIRENILNGVQNALYRSFENQGKGLTDSQWDALTDVLIRSDLGKLLNEGMSPAEAISLVIDKAARKKLLDEKKAAILNEPNGKAMLVAAMDLSAFMLTQEPAQGQLTNTFAIAAGLGRNHRGALVEADAQIIKDLDTFVALQYLNNVEYSYPTVMTDAIAVIKKETPRGEYNGVNALVKAHKQMTDDAYRDLFVDTKESMMQGYTPDILNQYTDLIVAENLDHAEKLKKEGYDIVQTLTPSGLEATKKEGVRYLMINRNFDYQRKVDGVIMYKSSGHSGTEANVDVPSTSQKIMDEFDSRIRFLDVDTYNPMQTNGTAQLVPRFNSYGDVIGYRYIAARAIKNELLERVNHPIEVLSKYAMGTFDAVSVTAVNEPVVDVLYDDFAKNYLTRPQDYIEVSRFSSDARAREAYAMLPYQTREMFKAKFGKKIYVKADSFNLLFGFKKLALSKVFDKEADSRNLLEGAYTSVMIGLFGERDARKYTVNVQRGIMDLVSLIKDMVVIRNLTTLIGNVKSNYAFLAAYNVNPVDMVRDTNKALRNGIRYRKEYARLMEIKQILRYETADPVELRKEMAALEDSLARNPLIEFINSGMMSNVVEDLERERDRFTFRAKYLDKLNEATQWLPSEVKTVAKHVVVAQGTPLHDLLSNATAMSDFVAKYVLYNSMKKKGATHWEAIHEAHEAFINYEVPTSRGMQFLNDMGFAMFTKFGIRIQRVIYKRFRDNAANVLLQSWILNAMGEATIFQPSYITNFNLPVHMSGFEIFGAWDEPLPIKLGTGLF